MDTEDKIVFRANVEGQKKSETGIYSLPSVVNTMFRDPDQTFITNIFNWSSAVSGILFPDFVLQQLKFDNKVTSSSSASLSWIALLENLNFLNVIFWLLN